ncbi:MAG: hypothetical protein DMG69_01100 [Acidobacteria bacterium]|nr:MAG: hypothetical protein DMG69_01100 [Acidobacteriota bacterium]
MEVEGGEDEPLEEVYPVVGSFAVLEWSASRIHHLSVVGRTSVPFQTPVGPQICSIFVQNHFSSEIVQRFKRLKEWWFE